jgi:NAD(P)-dependent dehydrogenase (short-subunit alcohol dehydrogenase family)
MRHLNGKVAVITGAASGIGRAMSWACAAAGMRVVMADIEVPALARAVGELSASGHQVIGIPTDVSSPESVADLAAATLDQFGAVHLLHNNAGVVAGGQLCDITLETWEWVMGVDLWSVLYGIRAFLPILEAQGEGHIVSTASTAGLQAARDIAPYSVAKFGVVALSETLAYELESRGSPVGVSVLCPGAVNTRIVDADRNRPAHASSTDRAAEVEQTFRQRAGELLSRGMDPAAVAVLVLDAVRDGRFWILTHPAWVDVLAQRVEGMRSGDLIAGFGG